MSHDPDAPQSPRKPWAETPEPAAAPPPSPPPYGAPAPPPGPYQPPPPGPYYQPPQRTNGFAVASLVLGIIWIYWIGSILALIFGYVAKGQIDASGGTQSGRGLAIAGIVLGWVGVGILLFILVLAAFGSVTVSTF